MPLFRNSIQENITLQRFYQRIIDESSFPFYHIGKKMLEIVSLINNLFTETQIWGLTSHANLILQSENKDIPLLGDEIIISCWYDKTLGDVLIRYIESGDLRNNNLTSYFIYRIGFLRNSHNNSDMQTAQNTHEAKELLLKMMGKSSGWKATEELNSHLSKNLK